MWMIGMHRQHVCLVQLDIEKDLPQRLHIRKSDILYVDHQIAVCDELCNSLCFVRVL